MVVKISAQLLGETRYVWDGKIPAIRWFVAVALVARRGVGRLMWRFGLQRFVEGPTPITTDFES